MSHEEVSLLLSLSGRGLLHNCLSLFRLLLDSNNNSSNLPFYGVPKPQATDYTAEKKKSTDNVESHWSPSSASKEYRNMEDKVQISIA